MLFSFAAGPVLKWAGGKQGIADELVRQTGQSVGEVVAALAELEVAGLAAEGDGIYRALR